MPDEVSAEAVRLLDPLSIGIELNLDDELPSTTRCV